MAKNAKTTKHVYLFGNKKADGDGSMKPLLGGKGANLAEMSRIGLPVPPGFTITTEVCTYYYQNKKTYPKDLEPAVKNGVAFIEKIIGTRFGDTAAMPLLVSVRSGARDSMPGMMDTILNLGLNDKSVLALVEATRNERFAWDCYRRFVQMYGDVVMGVQKSAGEDHEPFEVVIHGLKQERYHQDIEDPKLGVEDLKELVARFKALIRERTGKEFPQDPWKQLWGAIGAVFGSWNNDRAIVYRRKYNIPSEWGTAVSVQAMVYGNTGEHSGSGVAFTRNPANGAKEFYGEFLINAQGEDVVAGIRTPEPVVQLKNHLPAAFDELENIRKTLETHFKDVQDFEFTIQDGKVFMLQTRNGKRTAMAALKFSIDMVQEKLIDWKTAIRRNPADQLDQLLAPIFEAKAEKAAKVIARGLPAGPGAGSGNVYLNAERAVAAAERGEKVLLVRNETSPEDLRGMIAAQGILTAKGGVSSHAALVARQMGKVCVCGAGALQIDYDARTVTADGVTYKEGDPMSINGTLGNVYAGQLPTAPSEIVQVLVDKTLDPRDAQTYQMFKKLMDWCSKVTRLQVRTNADLPGQAANAVAFGATGVGLTRTEHMFFEGNRIDSMRQMILSAGEFAAYKSELKKLQDSKAQAADIDKLKQKYASDIAQFEGALAKLMPMQRGDFVGIFQAINGLPATIRTLDPPLHEFLPHDDAAQKDLAAKMGVPVEKIKQRVNELHEFNPMLGMRGCRLGIVYPEISEMQCRAIFEAAAQVQKQGVKVKPEIMIPLVGFKRELDLQVDLVHRVAREVMAEQNVKLTYMVGTMIEIPRGALTADEIAQTAQFFSFGTNDLTQTCLGMSRDDSGSFLAPYQEAEILKKNPFASIDQAGVGQLMKIAVERGRSTRPDIKLGICGEHGGDPESVKFCHRIGLAYVSCSPFRVPIARLAAAQAALEEEEKTKKPGGARKTGGAR
ncbi:MAG: pyruvate, phosphate dikinase [Limisphaerales bacterium]